MNMTQFSEHGWRIGNPKGFYISIDDTNAIYEKYSIATDCVDEESESN